MARQVRTGERPQFNQSFRRPMPSRRGLRPNFNGWQGRGILALVVLGAVAYLLDNSFAIKTIVVKPTTRSTQLTAETRQMLDKWGQGNLLTLNSARVVSDLEAADPVLSQAHISRQWPHGITLTVVDKVASLGWQTGSTTYVVDATGSIIGPAPSGSTLLVVHDDSNLGVKVADHVATSTFVTFCQSLSPELASVGLKLTALDIKQTTIDLYAKTDKGYQIILDTTRPAGEQVADLRKTLATLSAQHKTPAQYIDVRISGRAYYQ